MSHQGIIELPTSVPTYEERKIVTQGGHISTGTTTALLEETMESPMKNCNQTYVYLLAGAGAGITEHVLMLPIDSIKTRLQSLRPHPNATYKGVFHAFSKIVKTEGILRGWRGWPAVALGAGPAHAFYFTSYEYTKKLLDGRIFGGEPILHAASGAVAAFFHDGTMNPVEVIKQRVQVYNSPYRNVFHCAHSILKNEGISAFYRSFSTCFTMNLPFQVIHFPTYEIIRKTLNPENEFKVAVHLTAGGCAGALAAACTSPLDVAKTLLNTQEQCVLMECKKEPSEHLRGMRNALRTIYTMHGVRGYFRGVQARVLFQIPSTALCWLVYEFCKHHLSLQITEEEMIELTS